MATKVNKHETVELQDGKEVEVRPLNIKNLRKFMAIVQKFQEAAGDELATLELMVEACEVALSKTAPEVAEDRDYLEENLDMPAIYKIMNIAGGVDMTAGDDANLTPTG